MSRGSDSSVTFGVGLLFGVVAGVVAGVLFSPKPGEEMRQEVKNVVDNFCDDNKDLNCCKSVSIDMINKMKYTIEKQINKINGAIRAGKLAAAKRKEELESGYTF